MKTVILAAGTGSRLWPLSTPERPKQFLRLINGVSPVAYTYSLMRKITPEDELYVSIVEGIEHHLKYELPNIKDDNVIVASQRKGLLAQVTFTLKYVATNNDEPVLFKAADQLILNQKEFIDSINTIVQEFDTKDQRLRILCTEYSRWDENSGYCQFDNDKNLTNFYEKPKKALVEKMSHDGRVFMSPMIFITSINSLQLTTQGSSAEWASDVNGFLFAKPNEINQQFLSFRDAEVSSTVFEHAKNIRVDEISCDYRDFGSFSSLTEANPKDSNGNIIVGNVIQKGPCKNSILVNVTEEPLVVISMVDSVVAKSQDGTLAAPISDANLIKDVLKERPI